MAISFGGTTLQPLQGRGWVCALMGGPKRTLRLLTLLPCLFDSGTLLLTCDALYSPGRSLSLPDPSQAQCSPSSSHLGFVLTDSSLFPAKPPLN